VAYRLSIADSRTHDKAFTRKSLLHQISSDVKRLGCILE